MYTDKKGNEIYVGCYVMIGVKNSSSWDFGEIYIGQVTALTPRGVEIEGQTSRIKAPHRMTIVSKGFHDEWLTYR